MYNKIVKLIALLLMLVLFSLVVKNSLENKAQAGNIEESENYYTVTFPKGSYFNVILEQPLDSSVIKQDDLFETMFPTDVYIGTIKVIPESSKAIGKVTYLERAHQGRDSLINLRFISIVGANGTGETPISARIVDKNPDGSIGGQLTNRTQVKRVVHYIEFMGAYSQAIPTGPREMGREVYIPPGERWVIELEEPARFIVPK